MKSFAVLMKSLILSLVLATSAMAAVDKVDINTASAVELAEALNGVGLSKAEAIVAHREQHGPFKSADQLAEVKGIGLRTVDKNRERIEIGTPGQ